MEFKVGDKVERMAPNKDYTRGRKGEVIEITGAFRCRVHWHTESDGSHIRGGKGIKTQVNENFLKKI